MKKIFILTLALTLASCSTFVRVQKPDPSNSTWKLVYYNSDEGEVLDGNLNNLINAVENGKQVRIVMEKDKITSAAEAQYLWVKDDVVYAQNNEQVSVRVVEGKLVFQKDSYYWMFIVNTDGERDMIRWSVGAHDMRGENEDRVYIKWFVKN